MDIARPVGSEINSVDFEILTTEEIRKLSAKQVVNPQVFDNLGHPIAGGLYDLALGAFLRNLCGTCGLDERFCPGHQGHIELPVPCYNPLFFNQLCLFLRSACVYCNRFKLKQSEVNFFACKLRLLQYGLMLECEELDGVSTGTKLEDIDVDDIDDGNDQGNGDDASLKRLRNEFVETAIATALSEGRTTEQGMTTSTIANERKAIIRSFNSRLLSRPKCDNCGMYSPSFRKDGSIKLFENALTPKQISHNRVKGLTRETKFKQNEESAHSDDATPADNFPPIKTKSSFKYILSTEVRTIVRKLFITEKDVLKYVFNARPNSNNIISADMFFIQALIVPPTRFRLPSKLGDEIHENSQNEQLSKILTTALTIRDLNESIITVQKDQITAEERKIIFNRLMNAFVTIQDDVNSFIDSTKSQNAQANPGIKQALEKKEGLFRKHMMGKRVNYAARSVISPDPMLETNEIGVPPVFAKKLTYPEPVTAYNAASLRQAIINGPDVWPGAIQIQNEDGRHVSLIGMTLEQRKAIANQLLTPSNGATVVNKKVYRHIKNNDIVIMNRQPTLHKASMMGHKVRVLPGEKTLRLHYANTGAYNADFDGDEMNMHLPQNENARAEAYNLANTDSQYLTPTSGSPVRGLIQDHISAGVWLTNKDSFFTREKYQQLIYGCLRPEDGHTVKSRIQTLPPTVLKPVPLWTGKQIITTILLNIKPIKMPGLNLKSKNKIKASYWGGDSIEDRVIIRNGELLVGILDKSQYGASNFGLIHSLHEVYGPSVSSKALSVLGRLFTNYIMMIGFTCGMDDLRLTAEGNKQRSEILQESVDLGRVAAAEVTNLPKDTKPGDKEFMRRLEEILRDDGKLGILDAVTQSKVNVVTSKVVSSCIPEGTMKRFPENSMQAMALSGAKGSNVNVSQIMCLLGQQALEGRRVPVMVSGKTLPSFKPFDTDARAGGYIKGRFYSGIRPQEYYFHCMAGREGLIDTAVKTSRSGYLQRCLTKQLEGAHIGYDNSVRDGDGSLIQFLYGGDSVDVVKESHMYKFQFCAENYDSLLERYNPGQLVHNLDAESALKYAKKCRKNLKKQSNKMHYQFEDKYMPVINKFNPAKYLGAVSEHFQDALDNFIDNNPQLFDKKSKRSLTEKKFRALMQLKYMRSLINPGEAVGIIASQSVGEPSTQMTLNTFHFAGHGAANVTLGIPRMREIIMTASLNIKTPQMMLPILDDVLDEQAQAFCRSVARVVLSEFIDYVTVTETSGSDAGVGSKQYNIRLNFFSAEDYEQEYDVTRAELAEVLVRSFLSKLEVAIRKQLKKSRDQAVVPDEEIGEAVPKSDRAFETSEAVKKSINDGDGDELDNNENEQGKEPVSYDEPDEQELEAMNRAAKSSDEEEEDFMSSEEEKSSCDDESDDEEINAHRPPAENILDKMALERQTAVISAHSMISAFNFDDKNGTWCEFQIKMVGQNYKLLMVNIIEELCQNVVVREIPNIGRCVLPQPEAGQRRHFITEGVNFQAMWEQDAFVDVDAIRSNDTYAVLRTYGVEAARNTIVNEINNVFGRYAIAVSSRHLDLIADMMTRQGTYLAFNRQGIENSTSSFMKMSYETTCQFLTKAVLDNDREELESPSARLVVGKLSKVGTGIFDVMARMPLPTQ
ncbi:RNA polymerase I subunit A190 [Komagataella phaffii CBS 7435]|uniref:DNA-directed RNA polymerase subunit n=2 Tax=Komagataella phaffii TaxID=460519 RepID=C4R1Z5_KOMPG|nr:RNA polymerase I subunit [Komagataella phaffii GS115]AOA62290.1 GQ67_00940T0 [Komagataella phaffii]CAH2447937.1 RNA polymerase I subunit A190 [Komagataella phaffii CBS 7435]AOA67914.1 GQ68_00449T0 [Komagataella phaffii GS115]CAY69519.1 RNA polymerase I subunit [Komagataella phaffii GS115]CCA38099.1 RNA polymerase I subunit A190 [Komagataella phaffii CBS 7435]